MKFINMKRNLPFSLTGFLSFTAGGLVAYWFPYQEQSLLAIIAGGAVSGVYANLQRKRVSHVLLAALGFALAALPAVYLIAVSIAGPYLTDGPPRLDISLLTMVFFISGFTIIGAIGAPIANPKHIASSMLAGIKSFALAGLCGSIALELLRLMDHIPNVYPELVVLLTYASAGGLYQGIVQRQDADFEKTRLTVLNLDKPVD